MTQVAAAARDRRKDRRKRDTPIYPVPQEGRVSPLIISLNHFPKKVECPP